MSRPKDPLDRFRKNPKLLWGINVIDISGAHRRGSEHRRRGVHGRLPTPGYVIADALLELAGQHGRTQPDDISAWGGESLRFGERFRPK